MSNQVEDLEVVNIDAAEHARTASSNYKREEQYRRDKVNANTRNWTIAALGAMAGCLLLAAALWSKSGEPSNAPLLYVIQMEGDRPVYFSLLKAVDPAKDPVAWTGIVQQELKEFITAWRTVTTDEVAARNDWDKAFAFVGSPSQASTTLNTWYRAVDENGLRVNDPIERSHKGLVVEVRFTSVDVIPDSNTMVIWWTETAHRPDGQPPLVTKWHARIAFSRLNTEELAHRSEAVRRWNPWGIVAATLIYSEDESDAK